MQSIRCGACPRVIEGEQRDVQRLLERRLGGVGDHLRPRGRQEGKSLLDRDANDVRHLDGKASMFKEDFRLSKRLVILMRQLAHVICPLTPLRASPERPVDYHIARMASRRVGPWSSDARPP